MSDLLRDTAAERAVLSGIFHGGIDTYIDVSDILTKHTFTVDTHSVLYACLEHALKENKQKTLDLASVWSAANDLGVSYILNKPDERALVRAILNFPVKQENVRRMSGKIRKLEIARTLGETLQEARDNVSKITGDESLSHILGLAEKPIIEYGTLLNVNNDNEPKLIGEGLEEYLNYLENNPVQQVGLPTGFPKWDKAIGGGVRRKTVNVIGARPKVGKAQPLDAIIHTPYGPKCMGDIKVGDRIFSDNGVSSVLGVYPQGIKNIYRVYFSDGDCADCCIDHLWKVRHRRKKDYVVKPLSDIVNNLKESDGRPKWRIPLTKPVSYLSRKITIDPYLLGVLLGDGGITQVVSFTNTDKEIISNIENILLDEYYLSKNDITYTITRGHTGGKSNWYVDKLREYGLFGLKSKQKFIPVDYKLNSKEIRLSLLQGLLDSDGNVGKKGIIEYSTTSLQLAIDVKDIVQSLGGLCNIKPRMTTCNDKSFLSYRLRLRFNGDCKLFRLKRKQERVSVRKKGELTRGIEKVELIGREKAQCIEVGSVDGLYLTNNFIVTHNTQIAAAMAMHMSGENNVPVLMLDTEMAKEDQWIRLLARFSRVEIDDIETGKYAKDSNKKQAVRQAAEFLKKAPFSYLSIAGQPFEDTIATMRRWVVRKVGTYDNGRTKDCAIIFDYLKLMSSDNVNESLKEYQILGFMMTGLHNFVHKYDIPCVSFVQLNRDGIDKESTDVVSQSDRIIWLCSNFSIYKKKSEDEISQERGEGHKNLGNRKLIPLVQRHGPGLEDGDYIDVKFEGKYATLTEGCLRSEMRRNNLEADDNAEPISF